MEIVTLITALLPLLTSLLSSDGVISPSLSTLITQLASAVPTLVANLINGKGVTSDIVAVLQTIQQEINTLKTGTTLFTLNTANEINALDKGISDALTAYTASTKTDDPSNLTPLPEQL